MRMPVWRINRKTLPPRSLRRRNSCWQELVLLGCEWAWTSLWATRNILAADEMSEFGKLFAPRQFIQDGTQSDEPAHIRCGYQRRHLRAQTGHPAEDVGLTAQLVEAIDPGVMGAEIA